MPRSSCSGSGGISTHPASATIAIARATKSARRITVYHSVSDSQRPHAAAHRHLQHSPLPRHGSPDQTGPNRTRPPRHRRGRHRAAGSHRPRSARPQPYRGNRRGARHGMGDGSGAACARPPVRQRRPQPVSDQRITCSTTCRGRTAGSATCSAWTSIVSGRLLHVYNVHLGTAILERRHQARRLATIVSDRHVTGPKIVLGDFNEWMRGLTTTLLSAKLKSVEPSRLPQAASDVPGPLSVPAPRSHLLRGRTGNRRRASSFARGSRSLRRIICRSWPTCALERSQCLSCGLRSDVSRA